MDGDEKNLNVLVVDDERQVCQSVQKILKRRGYQVESELCVAGALHRLEQQEKLDLIIADLMMPQTGGIDLLKSMRDRWPQIPVLIITGYASIASAVETTRLGAAGYIPKPFTPEELEEAVEKVVVRGPWKRDAEAESVIDVDMPFNPEEVKSATSEGYVRHLTRSDVPVVDAKPATVAEDFCALGNRNCKRFKTKGICREPECPIVTAERKKGTRAGIVSPTVLDPIDVDMPFSASEVAAATSEAYLASLDRSDMPNAAQWRTAKAAGRRVLVVDDEVVVVNSIRKSLIRKGHAVDEAFTGKEALARILMHHYDLVLLDMRMPDLNGLELLPKIKNHRPNLPVVIVTGYASIDTATEAIRRGANDYLGKPFSPDELYDVTTRALRTAAA